MTLPQYQASAYPAGPVASSRRPRSIAATIGAIVALVAVAALVITKIFTAGPLVPTDDVTPRVLGGLGLATIIVILIAIVCGHVGLAATRTRKSGRASAGIALGLGYFLLLLYIVRIVNAALTVASANAEPGEAGLIFLGNIFWWA